MVQKLFGIVFFLNNCLAFTEVQAAETIMTPDAVLETLMKGNSRFVQGVTSHPSYPAEARDKLLEGQAPVAAIVGCSDSRVPPELIFDRGLGELFVVRDAGNVVGPIEMDSVEFAVAKLNVPLVIVLGHQNCGAVKATLAGKDNVPELEHILPLIDSALKNCDMIDGNTLINAIYCNVRKGVDILKNSPTIAPILARKKVKVVGAYYSIDNNKVTLIPD